MTVRARLVSTRPAGPSIFRVTDRGIERSTNHNTLGFFVRRERGSRCSLCGLPSATLIAAASCTPLAVGEPAEGSRNWWGVCASCAEAIAEVAEEVRR